MFAFPRKKSVSPNTPKRTFGFLLSHINETHDALMQARKPSCRSHKSSNGSPQQRQAHRWQNKKTPDAQPRGTDKTDRVARVTTNTGRAGGQPFRHASRTHACLHQRDTSRKGRRNPSRSPFLPPPPLDPPLVNSVS